MDEFLKRVFAALRQADQGSTPPFERVWAAAASGKRQGNSRGRWALTALGATSALLVGVWLLRRPTVPALDAANALASWQSPTASLLRFPGDDVLRAVPTIGASHVRLETLQPAATTPRSEAP